MKVAFHSQSKLCGLFCCAKWCFASQKGRKQLILRCFGRLAFHFGALLCSETAFQGSKLRFGAVRNCVSSGESFLFGRFTCSLLRNGRSKTTFSPAKRVFCSAKGGQSLESVANHATIEQSHGLRPFDLHDCYVFCACFSLFPANCVLKKLILRILSRILCTNRWLGCFASCDLCASLARISATNTSNTKIYGPSGLRFACFTCLLRFFSLILAHSLAQTRKMQRICCANAGILRVFAHSWCIRSAQDAQTSTQNAKMLRILAF